MIREEVIREWKHCKEKVNGLSNLKKWIEQQLELDNFDFSTEYLADFKYLKESLSYHKNKEYCPRCGCEKCQHTAPNGPEELDYD